MEKIKAAIRDIPDFPKPGVLFKDITPVLERPEVFKEVVDHLSERYRDKKIDKIIAVESRGFIFGAPLAVALGAGLVTARKFGKLPHETIGETYTLEYGEETLEMHKDSICQGERLIVIDDLLATGGTAAASVKLARRLGGQVVEAGFLVELKFLNGRKRLQELDVPVFSLVEFD